MNEQLTPYKPTQDEFDKGKDMAKGIEKKTGIEIARIASEIDKQIDTLYSKIESLGSGGENARGYSNALASQSRYYAKRACKEIQERLRDIKQVQ